MLVKFNQDYGNFKEGDVVEVAPAFAEVLFDEGVAEKAEAQKKEEKKAKG